MVSLLLLLVFVPSPPPVATHLDVEPWLQCFSRLVFHPEIDLCCSVVSSPLGPSQTNAPSIPSLPAMSCTCSCITKTAPFSTRYVFFAFQVPVSVEKFCVVTSPLPTHSSLHSDTPPHALPPASRFYVSVMQVVAPYLRCKRAKARRQFVPPCIRFFDGVLVALLKSLFLWS